MRRCDYVSCLQLVILLITLLVLSLVPVSSYAEDLSVQVSSLKGTVSVKRAASEKSFAAFVGLKLKQGDVVTTSKNGEVVINIGDDKTIKGLSNSSFKISSLSGTNEDSQAGFTLIKGSVFNEVRKKQSSAKGLTVQTGNTVVGVRGTTYTVSLRATDGMTVRTLEGSVFLDKVLERIESDTNASLSTKQEVVEAGQGASTSVEGTYELSITDFTQTELEYITQNPDDFAPEIITEVKTILESLPALPDTPDTQDGTESTGTADGPDSTEIGEPPQIVYNNPSPPQNQNTNTGGGGGNTTPPPPPALTYTIAHNVPGGSFTFPTVEYGYPAQSSLSVNITNTGTGTVTGGSIVLSSGSDFTLSKTTLSSVTAGGHDTFTVTPNTGLSPGTHTATVTVTGMPGGQTASFTVSFSVDHTYTIAHNVSGNAHTFPSATSGYSAQTPLSVNITNTGTGTVTGGSIVLSSGLAFTLSKTDLSSINSGASDTFTVTPNTGLSPGTHTATVTVTGMPGGQTASFTVSFSVDHTYTIAHNVTGGSFTFPTVEEGYPAQSPLSVNITNTGTGTVTGGSIVLSSGSGFTLSKTDLSSINSGASDTFTVTPNTGLSPGTYTATVTVTGMPGGQTASFTVNLGVNNNVNPTSTITFDANGGSGGTQESISNNSSFGSLMPANPVRANYDFGGWNSLSDGSGTAFTSSTAVTGNMTVYAMWFGENEYYPVLIKNAAVLASIDDNAINLSKYYSLENDITLSGNWTPIGNDSNPFTGSFDGNLNSISNISITGDVCYSGLFGYIGTGGTVRNLLLSNVDINISTNATTDRYAGAVVGYNYGTIMNCSAQGSVRSTSTSYPSHVGGIAGHNKNTMMNCYSSCDVYGASQTHTYVGGVVGFSSLTVTNCYSTGDVTCDSSTSRAGGVAGVIEYDAVVQYCYSTGEVTANNGAVGGIVGWNQIASITTCAALNPSVSTANVDTPKRVIGSFYDASSIHRNNYANSGMTVLAAGITITIDPSSGGYGLNDVHGENVSPGTGTGQFNNQDWWLGSDYIGWGSVFGDSDNTPWVWDNTRNLPMLYWQTTP